MVFSPLKLVAPAASEVSGRKTQGLSDLHIPSSVLCAPPEWIDPRHSCWVELKEELRILYGDGFSVLLEGKGMIGRHMMNWKTRSTPSYDTEALVNG
jgi:hypothetical protein